MDIKLKFIALCPFIFMRYVYYDAEAFTKDALEE